MELFFDTNRVASHIDAISEEKRIAQNLLDNLKMIKRISYMNYNIDPALASRFQQIIKMTDELVQYYTRLNIALNESSDDAVKIVLEIGRMLDDSRINVKEFIDI